MIFALKRVKTNTGTVEPWTPIPEARQWPGFQRMLRSGTLVEVPDHLLAADLKPKRKRGRPRKRVE
jgi:hypothetical protein